jgi:hypothetical protein
MGNMRTSLYLALLPLLFVLAAAFSVHPHKAVGGIKGMTSGIKLKRLIEKSNCNNELSNEIQQSTRSVIVSAVVAVSLFAAQPSDALFVESGDRQKNPIIITLSSNIVATSSTQNINTASPSSPLSSSTTFSSLQLSNSMASPMGEFKPEAETGISPAASTFGQWFFLLYVVVSLLAGAKEIGGRIMKQMNNE